MALPENKWYQNQNCDVFQTIFTCSEMSSTDSQIMTWIKVPVIPCTVKL